MKFHFNGYFFKNEKDAFEDVRKVFLKKFSISENFLLHIHSVSDHYSKELNEHYFQKNYPTDVLTIPLYKDLASINKLDKKNNEILGDLFLNRKLIKKHSKKYTKTLIEEYIIVVCLFVCLDVVLWIFKKLNEKNRLAHTNEKTK